ncbi:MAG TPA: bifunctional 23S rRNA (guanine(2069)-N(7))-methyltransferase RlmK/23S rRNA (guanine(2445)-N(2))-methyltransferase RlmL [Thermoguttaceae bacterium]|nr:bifunctional 23S rRNA (guanine(2069)-N(7))-methyltransferase RlmK/23S rRNA (guanine(2445)-N(2))-methyltransferase RlmL [Thermoguttaceae bacterium]
MNSLSLIATATFGLEAVVARELQALGYATQTIQAGRVLFHGDPAAIARANLWLRAADRVLLRLGTFEATDFGQLFDATHALPWHEWLPADACFPVSGRSIKSQLSSVPACQKIVKKAIVEKLRAAHGVETLDETGPRYSVEVALLDDQATLTLDTTGPGLHKRGYRKLVGRAPLKETLAAAMILLSYWRPDRPLIDPFCGAGTIPIEAALIARDMAPGLNREFAAESWPAVPADHWQSARQEARDRVKPAVPVTILGTDTDDDALKLARYHAAQAGVDHDVQFSRRDFHDLTSTRKHGCVICNPPYGQRIGDRDDLRDLYRAMPEVLRRLKTWSHYILTSYPDFEQLIGQQADRRRKLYNGRIQCTYYQFHGPKPERAAPAEPTQSESQEESQKGTGTVAAERVGGDTFIEATEPVPFCTEPVPFCDGPPACLEPPAADIPANAGSRTASKKPASQPAFGGLSRKAREQADLFARRLAKRAAHLRRWPTRQGITCFRLYERDVPEIPLVVDRYEDCLHIAEFERPHDRTVAEHADWLDLMVYTAAKTLGVDRKRVFLKRRERQRGKSQYERVDEQSQTFVIGEGGLRFEVNLSDYLDTGLFLDHRVTRSIVRDEAAGKRFLNLFGYTGSFTVYAAAGGAVSTTTVDLSNTYLDWARRNMALNGLAGPEHQFVRDDGRDFVRHCRDTFDLAVVDPPTFSNSKRTDRDWDIQRDYAELLNALLQRMSPGGVVFFSTNFRRFKFDPATIPGATFREITRQTLPPDFRNQRIHRCWRIVRA